MEQLPDSLSELVFTPMNYNVAVQQSQNMLGFDRHSAFVESSQVFVSIVFLFQSWIKAYVR